jgi:hypothetical protein
VAQRAGISRKTLYRIERGDLAVALGIYARVLQALRLENDLGSIASDDLSGRKLQDPSLEPKRRDAAFAAPPIASLREFQAQPVFNSNHTTRRASACSKGMNQRASRAPVASA